MTRLTLRNRNKFRAQKQVVDGITFDSKREAKRYGELKLLERAGDICDLELQPKYWLGTDDDPVLIKSKGYPNGRRCSYRADFRYYDKRNGWVVVEDCKGFDDARARLRRAFVEWQYKIEIVLI